MKSWSMRIDGTGATLEKLEAPKPEPGPQQLLVRVRAAALNRWLILSGRHPR